MISEEGIELWMWYFCMLIKTKVFYKLILLLLFWWGWLGMPKVYGKTPMSLWHLKKEARNEVRELFAPADSNTTIYNIL